MRILIVARLPLVLESTYNLAVNEPVNLLRLPVIRICVEFALGVIGSSLLGTPVVIPSDALSEIIGLHEALVLAKIVTRPFKIEFVFVITHENTASDEAIAGGSLEFNVDTTEHKIILGPDVGSIVTFDEGEISTRRLTESD